MNVDAEHFLAKAEESLAGATSELAQGRYNNVANRCYYACFQAAIAALRDAGVTPVGPQWSHAFVQGQFVGQLINRRKVYPTELRQTHTRLYELRVVADYTIDPVSEVQATRALQRARTFVDAVRTAEGERR